MKRVVIIGAGTAGTVMANRLSKMADPQVAITVIDPEPMHVYQPGLLFVPFGMHRPEEVVKDRVDFLPRGAEYLQSAVDHVVAERNLVVLEGGGVVQYDVLIVATGTRIAPEETDGLLGEGWGDKMFEFYTLEGASALAERLAAWPGGRLVINIVDMPIKCPVAPLEFAFLADWFFTRRGIRDRVEIVYATPLDGAFTKPLAARQLKHLLTTKEIELVTEFNTGQVDGSSGRLISWDDRTIDFDLLVSVPLHKGADFVGRSPGLGDDLDFVITDQATLQAKVKDNVFAIGDATNVPTSKAGSVAHFQAEVLSENVRRYLKNLPLEPAFDGHANCFVETGFRKALLIDFNYDVEPLPGKFPLPAIGPMSLLKESRLNHLGKLAFRWIYWNVLLPGRKLPGISHQLSMRGKKKTPSTPTGAGAASASKRKETTSV